MISPEFQQRLEMLAARFGRKSGNKVAEEILSAYADFWEQVEEIKAAEIARQRATLSGVKPEKRKAG